MEGEEAAGVAGVEVVGEGRLVLLLEGGHAHGAVVLQLRAGRGRGPEAGPEVEELGVVGEHEEEEEQD